MAFQGWARIFSSISCCPLTPTPPSRMHREPVLLPAAVMRGVSPKQSVVSRECWLLLDFSPFSFGLWGNRETKKTGKRERERESKWCADCVCVCVRVCVRVCRLPLPILSLLRLCWNWGGCACAFEPARHARALTCMTSDLHKAGKLNWGPTHTHTHTQSR